MIKSYIAIDLETTGINPQEERIIEIGAIKVIDGKECGEYKTFINPGRKIPARITEITGIDDSMVCDAPRFEDIFDEFQEFIEELPLLGHNVIFDYSFIKCAAATLGKTFEKEGIDTLKLARKLLPDVESKKLEFLCGYFDINPGSSHRAFDDARSARILYEKLYERNPEHEGFLKTTKLEYGIKKVTPVTPAQLKYIRSLISIHKITLKTPPETLSKSEASRLIDTILSTGKAY